MGTITVPKTSNLRTRARLLSVYCIGKLTSGTILSIIIFMSALTSLSQFSHIIREAVVCLTVTSIMFSHHYSVFSAFCTKLLIGNRGKRSENGFNLFVFHKVTKDWTKFWWSLQQTLIWSSGWITWKCWRRGLDLLLSIMMGKKYLWLQPSKRIVHIRSGRRQLHNWIDPYQ